MLDREWFTVELPGGDSVDGKEYQNRETAVLAARGLAPGYIKPLTVVKYTRREVRTFTPRILVDEADVGTGAVSTA
jgi:hypothetical protein